MKRNTLQKNIVISALKRLGNHPTASMVYQEVHLEYPRISRSTVFRILSSLSEEGVVLRLLFPDSQVRYDHQTHPHDHIRCRECGCIGDISFASPKRLLEMVSDTSGFRVEECEFFFTGLCPDCQAKQLQEAMSEDALAIKKERNEAE